jgi:hypothetical protein
MQRRVILGGFRLPVEEWNVEEKDKVRSLFTFSEIMSFCFSVLSNIFILFVFQKGATLCHYAAWGGYCEALKHLIKGGSNNEDNVGH